jgi:rhodanese-related sulfurtransferase
MTILSGTRTRQWFAGTILTALVLASNSAIAEVTSIDSDELLELLGQDAVVIDVRRDDEWHTTGVIENSHTVTFFDQYGGFDAEKWLEEISAIAPMDTPIVLICHVGVRSKWVAEWLDNTTEYSRVYNHPPGIAGWMQQGRPLIDYE